MNSSQLSLATLTSLILTGTLWAGVATLTIDAAKAGPRLNPRLYGIFLEEINHGPDKASPVHY